ncbi:hypothetical protein NIES4072_61130 [Nostoc commune NIES-4072]|uniref:Uncharacterized protein n=1 Tax=Nostoc commune NIES-4072 TaxID=2005467 RepID=A0A2R5FVT0_NOSCO|nr:hypothetical protein [Nostoc commune]BBD66614.1 hypothetical protein NIES4070_29830 [Nostoc commune HK-02]GBG22405.1 hypothetical protein NIES4072_61130 [Nostoc commune NIES-4072]
MDNISTDIPSENTTVSDSQATVLPRSPWNSQLAYLRVIFRAKKALDRIEKEAGVLRNEN